MSIGPHAEKIAEFVANFGRLPTAFELEHGVCDDCYAAVMAVDRRAAIN